MSDKKMHTINAFIFKPISNILMNQILFSHVCMCTSRCAESLWLFKNEVHNVCPKKPSTLLNKNQLHLNSKICLLIHVCYTIMKLLIN